MNSNHIIYLPSQLRGLVQQNVETNLLLIARINDYNHLCKKYKSIAEKFSSFIAHANNHPRTDQSA